MYQTLHDIAERTGAIVDCDALRFATPEQARAFVAQAMQCPGVTGVTLDLTGRLIFVRLTLGNGQSLRDAVGKLLTNQTDYGEYDPYGYYP